MSYNKTFPSNEQITIEALQQRLHTKNILFSETEPVKYWRLSDFTILYPNIFDIKRPVSKQTIHKINSSITSRIPEFQNIIKQPVHILDIKETYNTYNKDSNTIQTIKRGTNQELTAVACEYLFRQVKGTELEQAYFLYKNKSIEELTQSAQELKFERARDQVSNSSNIISAIINRSTNATKSSFAEIWSLMWCKLFGVNKYSDLQERFNIKSSPLDYMSEKTLTYMNGIFQEIILHFCNRTDVHIEEIKDCIITRALIARAAFIRYGSKPEEKLLDKSSYSRIVKIRHDRLNFWKHEYPQSLQLR